MKKVEDVQLTLTVKGKKIEEIWWRKLSKKNYEKIVDFFYDELDKF